MPASTPGAIIALLVIVAALVLTLTGNLALTPALLFAALGLSRLV